MQFADVDAQSADAMARTVTTDTDARHPLALAPGDPVSRYVIESTLGTGGMGVVFAARDPKLDRRVALKLLHPAARRKHRTTEGRARLVREAQAMAKLSHPNVVSVFDVGEHEQRVFVAMEYVEGVTLDEWLREQQPSRGRVLDVFEQAARGLAAAHRAGFVHRDFKPTNVMVTPDDRALVMDFGLARGLEDDGSSEATRPRSSVSGEDSAVTGGVTGDLASKLTQAGVIMGTPAYMAPEQHLGKSPDARADQFSLCATLWEALHGTRAFPASSMKELAKQKIKGRPDPGQGRVPERLRRVLLRGMLPDPASRYPSILDLLAALRQARGSRRPWVLPAAGGLALAGIAVAVALPEDEAEVHEACGGAQQRVAEVWNDARRAQVREAFDATDAPFAADTWDGAQRRLDDYAQDWAQAHREACVASQGAGASEATLDARMACLGRRLDALAATVDVLAAADRSVVERAVAQVSGLPPIATCEDPEAAATGDPVPHDPRQAERVAEIRRRLDAVRALELSGRYEAGLAQAQEVLVAARQTEFTPVVAEALIRHGSLLQAVGRADAAEQAMVDAAWMAEGARHDNAAVDAATRLVFLVAEEGARHDDAMTWARHARAWLDRAHPDPLAEARLESNVGIVHSSRSEFDAALRSFERAYAVKREILGERHPEVAGAIENMGLALSGLGRLDEALTHHERALSIFQEVLGERHPDVALSVGNLGHVYDQMGRHEESFALYSKAKEIHEAALGARHPMVARDLDAMGMAASALARLTEARGYHERALDISREVYGDRHPDIGWAYGNLGIVADQQGEHAQALEFYEKTLQITVDVYGEEHDAVASTYANMAMSLAELDRGDEALAMADKSEVLRDKVVGHVHPGMAHTLNARGVALYHTGDKRGALAQHIEALAILEETLGADHPQTAGTLLDMASVEVELARPTDALTHVRRTLEALENNPVSPAFLASAHFVRAQARWDAGLDRAEARREARQARDLYGVDEKAFDEAREEIDEWLAEHRL